MPSMGLKPSTLISKLNMVDCGSPSNMNLPIINNPTPMSASAVLVMTIEMSVVRNMVTTIMSRNKKGARKIG